jgi:predicted dehydrogenase
MSEDEVIASLNMDFIRRDPTRTCTAIGEKGSLRWDGIKNIVELYKSHKEGWVEVYRDKVDISQTYESQWQNFINCVAKRQNPQVTGEDGLRVLEVIEACRKSAPNGEQVMVEYSL